MLIKDVSLKINRNQRLPCVLVLDGSTSMADSPSLLSPRKIDLLNEGRRQLSADLKEDETAAICVQIMEIAMGGHDEITTVTEFCDATMYQPNAIEANGSTPLGAAVMQALELCEQQKQNYRDNGIPHLRPWIFILADGEPTDNWKPAAEACIKAEQQKKALIFPVGIGETADLNVMSQFSSQMKALRLNERKFKEFFKFVSSSVAVASISRPGDRIELPRTDSWVISEA